MSERPEALDRLDTSIVSGLAIAIGGAIFVIGVAGIYLHWSGSKYISDVGFSSLCISIGAIVSLAGAAVALRARR